jgi:hypothetical protein
MGGRARFAPIAVSVIAALLLGGCFVSEGLLKEQRMWDVAWQGRYLSGNTEYVVLAADAERRTYLIGQKQKSDFSTYRAAIYPGWDDVLILGTVSSAGTGATYQPMRVLSKDKIEPLGAACAAVKGSSKSCSFTSVDALREAIKESEKTTQTRSKKPDEQRYIVRMDGKLSTINVATELATFEDGDGLHGVLRVAQQSGLPAGMTAGDQIVAVGGERASSGGELLLRIAVEKPGAKLRLTLVDQATKAEREVEVTTSALK